MEINDELFKCLFHFITQVHSTAQQTQRQGSFRGQGKIIFLLAKNEGIPQRQLADLAQIKPSSLTQLLERLEKNELIRRKRDQTDRRILRVWLTAKGKQYQIENLVRRRKYEELLLANLTVGEKRQFIQTLNKMILQIDKLAENNRKGAKQK